MVGSFTREKRKTQDSEAVSIHPLIHWGPLYIGNVVLFYNLGGSSSLNITFKAQGVKIKQSSSSFLSRHVFTQTLHDPDYIYPSIYLALYVLKFLVSGAC